MKTCDICGATENETRIIASAKYGTLCRKHYLRRYKNKNEDRSIYDANVFIEYDDYAEIVLFDKNCQECARAKIDLEDVEKCRVKKWHLKSSRNTNYVISHGEFLHRFVLDYDGDMDVDHINHDGLDNRKSNLRVVSHAKNITNKDREDRGVKQVPSGNYQVAITKDGKTLYLGTFTDKELAKKTRRVAEEVFFPE